MTLIIAATSKDWLWMTADRRLSVGTKTVKSDAMKIMCLGRSNGCALFGYAGLGATGKGNEPSQWMSNVLRGTKLPLEESLCVLANAANRELPRHLIQTRQRGNSVHNVIIPAFLDGKPRVYSIDLAVPPDGKGHYWRFTRHNRAVSGPLSEISPRIVMAGSGARHLQSTKTKWTKRIMQLVKAHNVGRIKPTIVADYFAEMNHTVSKVESTVGPECVVVWRHKEVGGGHQFYVGKRKTSGSSIPSIESNGMDVAAIGSAVMSHFSSAIEEHGFNGFSENLDMEKLDRIIRAIPETPDDKLA